MLWLAKLPLYDRNNVLKTLDTIRNCQRLVFSVGVSQQTHKITNLLNFEVNWSLKLQNNNERKTPSSHQVVCFQMLDFETSKSHSELSKPNSWKITSFSKGYFRGSCFSQCFILSTALKVSFYANNYFEELPIVSTAFNRTGMVL